MLLSLAACSFNEPSGIQPSLALVTAKLPLPSITHACSPSQHR